MAKYYSTQRPVGPGTCPKPENNKIIEVGNFDTRIFVDEINRPAWGWIEYAKPLSHWDMRSYELIPLKERELHLRYLGRDSWSRYVYEDENGTIWKLTDCLSPRECCEERGDVPVTACGNVFDGEPDCPMATDITVVYLKEKEE